jgi:hypothetical protein
MMYSEVSEGAKKFSGEKKFITEQPFLSGRSPSSTDKIKRRNISDARKALHFFKTAKGSVYRTAKNIEREELHLRKLIEKFGLNMMPDFDDSIVKHASKEWNYRCVTEKLKALRTVTRNTTLQDLESNKVEAAFYCDYIEECGADLPPKLAKKMRTVVEDYNYLNRDEEISDADAAKSYINHYRKDIWKGEKELTEQLTAAGIKITGKLGNEIALINEILVKLNTDLIESKRAYTTEKDLPGKRNNGFKNGQALSQAIL